MTTLAYAAVMIVIAVGAAFVVLYHGYKETLTQCISLACIALGAAAEARITFWDIDSRSGLWLLLAGTVLFAIATMVRNARQPRRSS